MKNIQFYTHALLLILIYKLTTATIFHRMSPLLQIALLSHILQMLLDRIKPPDRLESWVLVYCTE